MRTLTLAALTLGATALAQTPAQICRNIGLADSITACMTAIANHEVQPEAARACGSIGLADSIVQCMGAVADKTYAKDEVEACRSIGLADQIVRCFAGAGRRKARRHEREDDARVPLVVVNRTAQTEVLKVLARRSGTRRWSPNLMRGVLGAGTRLDLTTATGEWDFCVETRDGQSSWWHGQVVGDEGVTLQLDVDDDDDVDHASWGDRSCRSVD